MRLIMLGPPGSGKGTQAALLKTRLGVPTISTGNILRSEITNGSDIGLQADAYISKGELVPDSIILDIVEKRLSEPDCEKGFILDGFPRTLAQAQALTNKGIEIDAVVMMDVSDDDIVDRMSGRRVCKKCDASFNLESKPPKISDVCDHCAGTLIIRDDDKPETVLNRLHAYHKNTEPLLEYYKNLLRRVVNRGTIEGNTQAVREALGL